MLQSEIETIKHISDAREMVLNSKKTFLFIANFTNNHQFRSMLQIPGSQNKLELAFETKLLGYWLTEDMKPKKHIKYILSIAYKRIWAVR